MVIVSIIIAVFVLRLSTLFYSIKNEKRLKSEGAVEYGQKNSTLMALLHTLIYLGSMAYAIIYKTQFDFVSIFGVILWIFSFTILLLVISQLSEVWTVKLLIAKNHKINKSFMFKYIRHPNYFLNIIPELVAVTLLCKSYLLFAIVFPFYVFTLILRISQEEKVMKQNFAEF